MIGRPPRSPLFPSPPLFRSRAQAGLLRELGARRLLRRGARHVALRQLPREAPERVAVLPDQGDRLAVPRDDEGEVVLRSEEHTSELQSRQYLVCRLLLEKKK